MTLKDLIMEEVKTYVGGLRFTPLFNSLTHYDGNEKLTKKQVHEAIKELVDEKKLYRMSDGRLVPESQRIRVRWTD